MQRLTCAELEIDIEKEIPGQLTHNGNSSYSASIKELNNAPLYVFDETDLSITSLQKKAYQLKNNSALKPYL